MKPFLFFVCSIGVVGAILLFVTENHGISLVPEVFDTQEAQKQRQQEQTAQEQQQQEANLKTCEEIIAGSPFYRTDRLQAVKVKEQLRQQGDVETADILEAISCVPQGIWVSAQNAEWQLAQVQEDITLAQQQEKIPVFVIYNGPNHTDATWRHVESGQAYEQWIRAFGNTMGNSLAWVIIEPDALPLAFTYSAPEREKRLRELQAAVQILKETSPQAKVYLDAGHGQWKSPNVIAGFLWGAGIAYADGFALNISNHQTIETEISYGTEISKQTNNAHFIIDVGQTGQKVQTQEWCNAVGRALGALPTLDTGNTSIDAFLWVKPPGESDGTCNGGPPAGKFWLDYALELIGNK